MYVYVLVADGVCRYETYVVCGEFVGYGEVNTLYVQQAGYYIAFGHINVIGKAFDTVLVRHGEAGDGYPLLLGHLISHVQVFYCLRNHGPEHLAFVVELTELLFRIIANVMHENSYVTIGDILCPKDSLYTAFLEPEFLGKPFLVKVIKIGFCLEDFLLSRIKPY